MRILNAMLTGGKTGVDLGLSIIPGVLIISTFVMILTFNTPAADFDGSAYQGVGLLPFLANKINFIFDWLFGFTNSELLAFPMTALGAVGAALGLIPTFKATGILDALTHDLGVYEGAGYRLHGIYRPTPECRMKVNSVDHFCPVCSRAISKITDWYTKSPMPMRK